MGERATTTLPIVSIVISISLGFMLFLPDTSMLTYVFAAAVFLLSAAQFEKKRQGYIFISTLAVLGIIAAFINTDFESDDKFIVVATNALCFALYHVIYASSLSDNINERYKGHLLKQVYNTAPDAILLLDFYSKKVVDCNDTALLMYGYDDKKELVGQDRDNFIINKLSESEFTQCRKDIALHGKWTKTLKHETLSGQPFWAKVSVRPLQLEKNKYYILRISDVDEKIKVQKDLTHTHEQLDTLINGIESLVISTSFVGKNRKEEIDFVSNKTKEVYGLNKEEFLTRFKNNSIEHLIVDDVEVLLKEKYLGDKNRKPYILHYQIRRGDSNEERWIEEHVFPKHNSDRELIAKTSILTDITLRKTYENQLKESEERYRTIFEKNLAGVYKIRAKDKVIIDCNDAFTQMLGYNSKKEIVGKVSSELYEGSSDQGQFHENLLDKKSIINHESKLHLKNGKDVWLLENSRVVEDDKGVHSVEGTVIDITELKAAQEALKHSEESLSMIINNLDDIVYNLSVDTEGVRKFNYISSQMSKVFGISVSEYEEHLQNGTFTNLVHDEDKDHVKLMFDIAIQKQKPISLTYRIINQKTNNPHWIEENIYPNAVDREKLVFFGIIRDITQKRVAEEAMRLSERRYRGLFERNMAGVFRIYSPEDRLLECNQSLVSILGYDSIEELKNTPVRAYYFNDADQDKFVAKLKSDRALNNYEVCLRRKDGEELWCIVNATYNSEDKTTEGTLIDISELKLTSEALAISEHALSTILDKLPGMAYRCKLDEDWTMEYLSDGCLEITGYEPEELLFNNSFSFNSLILPEYDLSYQDMIDRSKNQRRFVYEYKIKDKSGKIKWVWEQAEVILDIEGNPIGLEGFITDITARKNYEEEINEKRVEYQNIIDGSPYGIVIHKDGKILFANTHAYNLLGINDDNKNQARKMTIYDFLSDEYHQEAIERKERLLQGETLDFIEVKLKRETGETIDVETRSMLTTFNGERAVHVVLNDISAKKELILERERARIAEEQNTLLEQEIFQHKKTQEQLKSNQRFTKNLLDSSLDMILGSSIQNVITEVNQAGLDRFGYTLEEFRLMHPKELYANEKDFEFVNTQLLKHGKFIGEVENKDKNGKVFSSILSSSLVRDDKGNIVGVMGISRDITEIKDVERVVSEQSSTIKSIFESNTNMLIWVVDKQMNYVSYNKSYYNAAKLLLAVEPSKGENLLEQFKTRLSDEDNNYFKGFFNKALKGSAQHFEISMKDVRNNEFWLEVYLSPIVLEDGAINEIACLAHEITDKKYAESKIKDSLNEKEVLLKEVHHRVKNNLQVISSILNLQSSYVNDANTLSILRESQNRIKSMSFIHESLYQTKNFSSINFSEYITNLTKNLVHTYQISPNKTSLRYEIEELSLNLDQAIPCGLIVNELVSNALKYAFPDDTDGELFIGLFADGDKVQIKVEDNGVGLPKDFDYENTNTLGLQLVLTLVEQLDGNLKLDSEDGTKYFITFTRINEKSNG